MLQAAGLAVLWLDNQAGCKGVCDRIAAAPRPSTSPARRAAARLCDDGECLDDALLDGLDARLAALPAERRAQGRGAGDAPDGQPRPGLRQALARPTYKRFLPECRTNDARPTAATPSWSTASTTRSPTPTACWARPSTGCRRRRALRPRRALRQRPRRVARRVRPVPARRALRASRPSAEARADGRLVRRRHRPRRAGIDRACLRGRLDAPLTHDNLYHTVLGLLDVTTPTYDRRLDIWSACERRDEG